MADFPDTIFHLRALQNYPGQVYNPDELTRLYAEDLLNLGYEITAIETYLEGLTFVGNGEPLCTGDPDAPELVFAYGDIVMS